MVVGESVKREARELVVEGEKKESE